MNRTAIDEWGISLGIGWATSVDTLCKTRGLSTGQAGITAGLGTMT
jgi:hypothetical protein